jgi:hypothetical protein
MIQETGPSTVPSDLGWDVPGRHLEVRGMPEAHAVRNANVSGKGLAEDG